MANFKRKRTKRCVRCTMCTQLRWQGNRLGRKRISDRKNIDRSKEDWQSG